MEQLKAKLNYQAFYKDDFRMRLKRFDQIQANEFINALADEPIGAYELHARTTTKTNDRKKIILLAVGLQTNKSITNVIKTIYKLFDSKQPLILLLNRAYNSFWISFNGNALVNAAGRNLIRPKTFCSKAVTSKRIWKRFLTWSNTLHLTSIDEVYDQISRNIYYCHLNQMMANDRPFRAPYNWQYLDAIGQKTKLVQSKRILEKRRAKTYNANEQRRLSEQIRSLDDALEQLNQIIQTRETMFD